MDGHGGRILRAAIAARQWRQAEAVCDGRQPACDPDAEHLELVEDGARVYLVPARNGAAAHRVRKVLVDGFWRVSHAGDGRLLDEDAA